MSEQSGAVATDQNDATRITFYGTTWCGDCHRSRRLLDRLGVGYTFVDTDADQTAADFIRSVNRGQARVPTILLGAGGPILVEPSDRELQAALNDAGLLAVGHDEAAASAVR